VPLLRKENSGHIGAPNESEMSEMGGVSGTSTATHLFLLYLSIILSVVNFLSVVIPVHAHMQKWYKTGYTIA
jgi:hypothetical protein